jgi:hypothetical protein
VTSPSTGNSPPRLVVAGDRVAADARAGVSHIRANADRPTDEKQKRVHRRRRWLLPRTTSRLGRRASRRRDCRSPSRPKRSGSGQLVAAAATDRKPGPSAGEFRFDAIASGISASTPVGALSPSAQGKGRRRRGWHTRCDRRAGLGGAVGDAGLRLKQPRQSHGCSAPHAALWSPSVRLSLPCLQPARSWPTVELASR